MLVGHGFKNEVQAEQVHDVVLILKAQSHSISPNFPEFDAKGHLSVKGLLGVYILPMFSVLQSVPCISDMALEV